jgi:putative transposase
MNDHRESQVELLRLMAARDADKKIRYRFWQRGGGYDRNLISKDAVISSIQYIHANPVRRGLVETPEDWPWSSARFYARREDYVMKMDDEILGILT